MKLIIQIPCYNEEKTLPLVIRELPETIHGIDIIETQVVDDGSSDQTVKVANDAGINHILKIGKNNGLANAFRKGVDNALKLDADYLVNTDGDNQYQGKDIEKLVSTAILEKADLVVGCRPIINHPEFSYFKKGLQLLGSSILRKISKTDIKDAASGFRVYSKNAMLHLNIYSDFSYCMETLIQLGLENMKIVSVDINVNPKTRESRLFKSVPEYLWKQGKTIINILILYKAKIIFGISSLVTFLISLILALRYLTIVLFMESNPRDFWPTIILSGSLLILSVFLYTTGILASLQSGNRKLLEEILYKLRMNDIKNKDEF